MVCELYISIKLLEKKKKRKKADCMTRNFVISQSVIL